MNFKELLRFSYGLVMGTSTPYLKPRKRFLFPTAKVDLGEGLNLLLGGSAVCGLLSNGRESLVVNVNQEAAALELFAWAQEKAPLAATYVALNSHERDFAAGLSLWGEAKVLDRHTLPDVIEIAGERVHRLAIQPAANGTEAVFWLEGRQVLFAGSMFYNRLHPILRAGVQPDKWQQQFEDLINQLKPKVIIPAEGDIGSVDDAKLFLDYLKDLMDPAVDFSVCRQRYDWPEIPSATSLEENFDLLREQIKSHTTFGRV